ncbi:MAG: hypothetical protein ACK559_08895, partial [bacterium]
AGGGERRAAARISTARPQLDRGHQGSSRQVDIGGDRALEQPDGAGLIGGEEVDAGEQQVGHAVAGHVAGGADLGAGQGPGERAVDAHAVADGAAGGGVDVE